MGIAQQLTVITFITYATFLLASASASAEERMPPTEAMVAQIALGQALFGSVALSRDHTVTCRSCHSPERAYADPRARSVGIEGKIGTRNAPSLVGVAFDTNFFWDGRRTKLEDAVLDPFTNPVELGWPSMDMALEQLRKEPGLQQQFATAFPGSQHFATKEQIAIALAGFIRSLPTGQSAYDQADRRGEALPGEAEHGRRLFTGAAGCSECHAVTGIPARFSDEVFHHSGIGDASQSVRLPELTRQVAQRNLDATALGQKVLTDNEWSSLGRFAVTYRPADIGAFRTPSLRNVAVTAPYMHDGSIATLREAVDHEVYYRGFSRGHPINLTLADRQALVAFLESLTDIEYLTSAPAKGSSTSE